MHYLRVDFRQGRQHKSSILHCGMRNGQLRRVNDGIVGQQNVDIDVAWTFLLRSLATHRFLESEKRVQQLWRGPIRIESNSAIEKPRLLDHLDRFGFVERRYSRDLAQLRESLNRPSQVGLAISQVRTQ